MVYLAHDAEGEAVAIKEYLPSSLVTRTLARGAPSISGENLPTYRNGLKCFFEEGRALARSSIRTWSGCSTSSAPTIRSTW